MPDAQYNCGVPGGPAQVASRLLPPEPLQKSQIRGKTCPTAAGDEWDPRPMAL